MDSWGDVKDELAKLGKRSATRRNDWSATMPCDWSPSTVTNPVTGMPFSDASAWELICDLIESGHVFTPKKMDKPPDTVAFETKIQLRPELEFIYIKIQLRHGKAWGRSFHNDLRSNSNDEQGASE